MTGPTDGEEGDGEESEAGDHVRVPIDDWDALAEHLERFAARGDVEADADRIELRVGSARFAVGRDGTVDAGMPLHDFRKGDVAALSFDHDRGRIRLEDEEGGLAYEFRRP